MKVNGTIRGGGIPCKCYPMMRVRDDNRPYSWARPSVFSSRAELLNDSLTGNDTVLCWHLNQGQSPGYDFEMHQGCISRQICQAIISGRVGLKQCGILHAPFLQIP